MNGRTINMCCAFYCFFFNVCGTFWFPFLGIDVIDELTFIELKSYHYYYLPEYTNVSFPGQTFFPHLTYVALVSVT